MSEKLSQRIAIKVEEICPCFTLDKNGGPALWHRSKCSATTHGSCVCVWHNTDTCEAGTWPQLSFVNRSRKWFNTRRRNFLANARVACRKS